MVSPGVLKFTKLITNYVCFYNETMEKAHLDDLDIDNKNDDN